MRIKLIYNPVRRPTFSKSRMLVLCSLAMVAMFGCSTEPTYPNAHLAGAVSVDGQPIQEGTIAFTPTGSTRGPAVGAKITAGRYDCPRVPIGELLMQINASRPTGKTSEAMGTTIPEIE